MNLAEAELVLHVLVCENSNGRTSPNSRSTSRNMCSLRMRRLARLRWNRMVRGAGRGTGGGRSAGRGAHEQRQPGDLVTCRGPGNCLGGPLEGNVQQSCGLCCLLPPSLGAVRSRHQRKDRKQTRTNERKMSRYSPHCWHSAEWKARATGVKAAARYKDACELGSSPYCWYSAARKSRASGCEWKVRVPPVNRSRTTSARSNTTHSCGSYPSSGATAVRFPVSSEFEIELLAAAENQGLLDHRPLLRPVPLQRRHCRDGAATFHIVIGCKILNAFIRIRPAPAR